MSSKNACYEKFLLHIIYFPIGTAVEIISLDNCTHNTDNLDHKIERLNLYVRLFQYEWEIRNNRFYTRIYLLHMITTCDGISYRRMFPSVYLQTLYIYRVLSVCNRGDGSSINLEIARKKVALSCFCPNFSQGRATSILSKIFNGPSIGSKCAFRCAAGWLAEHRVVGGKSRRW